MFILKFELVHKDHSAYIFYPYFEFVALVNVTMCDNLFLIINRD
jgi:hypothetical protein